MLGPKIHYEGLTSQHLGSNQDVLRFGRNAVDRTPVAVKENLSEIDFLFHQCSCGKLKLFPMASHLLPTNKRLGTLR